MQLCKFQWLPWQQEPRNNEKTGEIIIIFIICVILKCGLSPFNTSKDISMLI